MANPFPKDDVLVPSLLDRLLDDDPTVQNEPPWRQTTIIRNIRESVRRDLRTLLNSHHWLEHIPSSLKELETSLVNYGLPDSHSLELREGRPAVRLSRLIEEAVRNFEPRLQGVRVTPVEGDTLMVDGSRTLRFNIEAVLVVEPLREPVFLTSELNLSRGDFEVEGSG